MDATLLNEVEDLLDRWTIEDARDAADAEEWMLVEECRGGAALVMDA